MVLKSLDRINGFCPYFCRGGGIWKVELPKDFREQSNPFAKGDTKHYMKSDLLLLDYVKGRPLSSLIKSTEVEDRFIFGAVKQTLGAIAIAHSEEQFTHYDLHSSNIIMRPCAPDSVSLFIHKDGVHWTPTYGAQSVVIDFGFSHARSIKKRPIHSSLAHTDIGFLTYRDDPIADAKLFLVSLAYELKGYRARSKHCHHFRKFVKNIFKPLGIDETSGWDAGYSRLSAIDRVSEVLGDCKAKSEIFGRYNHFSLDILQGLIKLPLRKKPYDDISLGFAVVDEQMKKLGDELGSPMFKL